MKRTRLPRQIVDEKVDSGPTSQAELVDPLTGTQIGPKLDPNGKPGMGMSGGGLASGTLKDRLAKHCHKSPM